MHPYLMHATEFCVEMNSNFSIENLLKVIFGAW